MSERETFFCWWEQRKERLSFAPMRSAAVGRSGVLISTGTAFTLWPMTTGESQHRIWASTASYWGTLLRSSDDFGKSWTNPQQAPIRFPSDAGVSLKNIWQIALGRPEEPNVLYCGVEPAALFETRDAGETWSLVRGLFDHPHRPRWMPGNGGLALHTYCARPRATTSVCMWQSQPAAFTGPTMADLAGHRKTRASALCSMPEKYPEFGQCVHKIAMHPDPSGTTLFAKSLGIVPL